MLETLVKVFFRVRESKSLFRKNFAKIGYYDYYLRAAAPAADPGKGTKQLLAPFSWQGNTMPLKDGEAPKLHPENA